MPIVMTNVCTDIGIIGLSVVTAKNIIFKQYITLHKYNQSITSNIFGFVGISQSQ